MPIHDWTRVHAGTFHAFHTSWISELMGCLNNGILPDDFYALSEQVERQGDATSPSGATAVAEAPPEVSFTACLSEEEIYTLKRRTLAIRHVSGDRVVAYVEILSPCNKRGRAALDRVLDKAVSVLNHGCHLLIIDLFPPGSFDPEGIHGAIWSQLSRTEWRQPADKPLTLAAYTGGLMPRAFVEPVRVVDPLSRMPLFLEEDWYVNLPLEETYQEAYASVPKRWRDVIER